MSGRRMCHGAGVDSLQQCGALPMHGCGNAADEAPIPPRELAASPRPACAPEAR